MQRNIKAFIRVVAFYILSLIINTIKYTIVYFINNGCTYTYRLYKVTGHY